MKYKIHRTSNHKEKISINVLLQSLSVIISFSVFLFSILQYINNENQKAFTQRVTDFNKYAQIVIDFPNDKNISESSFLFTLDKITTLEVDSSHFDSLYASILAFMASDLDISNKRHILYSKYLIQKMPNYLWYYYQVYNSEIVKEEQYKTNYLENTKITTIDLMDYDMAFTSSVVVNKYIDYFQREFIKFPQLGKDLVSVYKEQLMLVPDAHYSYFPWQMEYDFFNVIYCFVQYTKQLPFDKKKEIFDQFGSDDNGLYKFNRISTKPKFITMPVKQQVRDMELTDNIRLAQEGDRTPAHVISIFVG